MGRFQNKKRGAVNRQAGYMLLVMMLFIAMMAIAALAAVPRMEMQVKRDREEEMIHRGAQYARAIRAYVKKFGRYPLSVTDLQDTNNIHFLRKAYKDPITGKDFRLLHMQDVQMLMGGMGPGGFTGNPGAAAGAGQPGSPAGTPVTGAGNGSADNSAGGSTGGDNSTGAAGNTPDGDNSGNASSSNGNSPSGSSGSGFGSSNGAGQVFGGGPIMGVASVSKDKTIRVFNNKDHYNEWLFVYDPTNDRGLITGPYQPSFASMGVGINGLNGVNGMNGNGTNTNGTTNNTGGGFGTQGMNGFQPMQQQPNPGSPMPQH